MHHHGENTHKHRHRSTGKKNNSTVVHPTGVENGGFEPDEGDEKGGKKENSQVNPTEEEETKKVYFWGRLFRLLLQVLYCFIRLRVGIVTI